MAALLSWRGVVRDFIGRQTRALANLLGQFIKPGSQIIVGNAKPPPPMQIEKSRLRFNRELVEREVAAREIQRFKKLLPPFSLALLGPRINQIEAHALEMFARDLQRGARLFGAVQPPEKSKLLIGKGLHAERHAINACRSIACKSGQLRRSKDWLRA